MCGCSIKRSSSSEVLQYRCSCRDQRDKLSKFSCLRFWCFLLFSLLGFVSLCFWQDFFKFWSLSLNCESKATSSLPCYTFLFPFLGYVMSMISHSRFPAVVHCFLTVKCSPASWCTGWQLPRFPVSFPTQLTITSSNRPPLLALPQMLEAC